MANVLAAFLVMLGMVGSVWLHETEQRRARLEQATAVAAQTESTPARWEAVRMTGTATYFALVESNSGQVAACGIGGDGAGCRLIGWVEGMAPLPKLKPKK